jgi:hypothetical protein
MPPKKGHFDENVLIEEEEPTAEESQTHTQGHVKQFASQLEEIREVKAQKAHSHSYYAGSRKLDHVQIQVPAQGSERSSFRVTSKQEPSRLKERPPVPVSHKPNPPVKPPTPGVTRRPPTGVLPRRHNHSFDVAPRNLRRNILKISREKISNRTFQSSQAERSIVSEARRQ